MNRAEVLRAYAEWVEQMAAQVRNPDWEVDGCFRWRGSPGGPAELVLDLGRFMRELREELSLRHNPL